MTIQKTNTYSLEPMLSEATFFEPEYNSYFRKLHSREPFRIGILRDGRNPIYFRHCGVLMIQTVALV